MYNFSIPSQLKAWIDRVAQAGRTFRYTAEGPQGLAVGKKVIVVSTRGGVYAGIDATYPASLSRPENVDFYHEDGLVLLETALRPGGVFATHTTRRDDELEARIRGTFQSVARVGVPVEVDRWQIDALYSGTQKCLSCPPGLAPVSFSQRAMDVVPRPVQGPPGAGLPSRAVEVVPRQGGGRLPQRPTAVASGELRSEGR